MKILPIIGSIVLISFGFFIIHTSVQKILTWKRATLPKSIKINEVSSEEGPIELTGTIESVEEPYTSPFTDTECVAYRYDVQILDGGNTETYDSQTCIQPFILDDGTGKVYIDPSEEDVEFLLDDYTRIPLTELPDEIEGDISERGSRQWSEKTLEQSSKATVTGKFVSMESDEDYIYLDLDEQSVMDSDRWTEDKLQQLWIRSSLFSIVGGISILIGFIFLLQVLL